MTQPFEAAMLERLKLLDHTSESIVSMSEFMRHHKEDAARVVGIWNDALFSTAYHQHLPLIYVANDVLQNSKQETNSFVVEFAKVLPSAFRYAYTFAQSDNIRQKLIKVLNVFVERHVYSAHWIQELRDDLLAGPQQKLQNELKQSLLNTDTSADLLSVQQALAFLKDDVRACELAEKRYRTAIDIMEKERLLTSLQEALQSEAKSRAAFLRTSYNYLGRQEHIFAHLLSQLAVWNERHAQLGQLKTKIV
eukprot:GILK01006860.1.p1 GENE.GILK01006860.1~~GILK01006860.1.p1  ORF type:complete len:250 (+),score=34.99 GILK01006860.1:44-793(+)